MSYKMKEQKKEAEIDETVRLVDPRPTSIVANVLLFSLVFLYVGRAHEAINIPIRLSLLATLVGMAFCFTPIFKNFSYYFKRSVTIRRVTYFFIWAVLITPFSRWPGGSVEKIIGFSKVYVFLLLAGIILMKYKSTRMGVFSHVVGLLVMLLFSVISDSESVRVTSVTNSYDPNEMAMIGVMLIPILFFSIKNLGFILKLASLGGIAICVVAIALSGSRGGMVGLLVVGGYLLAVSPIAKIKKIMIVSLAMVVFVAAVPPENLQRLTDTLDIQNDYNMTSKKGRITIWKENLVKIVRSPIVGVGFGQSRTLEEEEMATGVWKEAHNSYIQVPLETGIPGAILMFPVWILGFKRLRSLRIRKGLDARQKALVLGLEGGLWGYLTCIIFLSVAYYPITLYYYLLIEAVYNDMTGRYLVEVKEQRTYQMRHGIREVARG